MNLTLVVSLDQSLSTQSLRAARQLCRELSFKPSIAFLAGMQKQATRALAIELISVLYDAKEFIHYDKMCWEQISAFNELIFIKQGKVSCFDMNNLHLPVMPIYHKRDLARKIYFDKKARVIS